MDIERLEELKKEVAESNLKVTGVGYLTDLQDLINAEIARQSVTSEEVAEVIEWLESEYVDDFEGYPETCKKFNQMVDLAITALQAYQPTISKTETTSCEWCDSGIDTASVMSADMMMRFVRPVNYCPNCGRRLED